ncbi:hypothetical protein BH10CYA1_BH10CYA1_33280 [soil metagenome]
MSTQAHNMLNKFRHISQNSTVPPAEINQLFTNQSLEDLLNGIPDSLLPPLALADGGNAFDGDATNDWFYPGRSVRNGMLPDVDLVEIQVMEFSRLV